MITPEIINYIKQQITLGISREQISGNLKQNGWNDADIAEAFSALANPANNVPHAPQSVVAKPSLMIRNIIIFIILLALLGGAGWWWFYGRKTIPVVQEESIKSSTAVQAPKTENFDDLKITYVQVPAEENSASIFNAVPSDAVAKADKDLMDKYLKDFPGIGSVSLGESKKILAKYKNILASFESGVDKKYYQCSLNANININCSLNILRDISKLATLNAFVLFKEGKVNEAEQYAQKIIKLGQMITSQSSDLITFLVGLVVRKMGYYALHEIKPIAGISAAEKSTLINNFRENHKEALRFEYSQKIEFVDYITDANKKPSWVLDQGTEDAFSQYRAAANSVTWKPDEIKKLFYDFFSIELSNVDLPCGSLYKDSVIDIGFDPEDTSKKENFVGKTFYSAFAASLSTVNVKRCEVESMINAL